MMEISEDTRKAYKEIYRIIQHSSKEIQIKRLRDRDGDLFLNRFINEWIPLEEEYFRRLEIFKLTDIII